MRIPFIRRRKPQTPVVIEEKAVVAPIAPRGGGGWFSVLESFTGAWQKGVKIERDTVLKYHAVFSCMTLIAGDIGKLRIRAVRKDSNNVWAEYMAPGSSRLLMKPNDYQTPGQFFEAWTLSKLSHGNTYVLLERDLNKTVVAMHVLDPTLVKVLVATSGDVLYEVSPDMLSGVGETLTVPASDVVHDRFNCLYHPLLGMSPITASGLAAMQGAAMQNNSTNLFRNASMPSGILTAPGTIKDETAARLKESWQTNYHGREFGKIAVLGDGLKYERMSITAVDAQLLEQLKWTAETVASTFHVPPFKIGIGVYPDYVKSIQALTLEYYVSCLQGLIEAIEACLDRALGFRLGMTGVEFDLDGLLRMDTAQLVTTLKDAVAAGIMAPNEARARLDLPPVVGGETPYLQQQNYSLAALAERGSAGLIPREEPPA